MGREEGIAVPGSWKVRDLRGKAKIIQKRCTEKRGKKELELNISVWLSL